MTKAFEARRTRWMFRAVVLRLLMAILERLARQGMGLEPSESQAVANAARIAEHYEKQYEDETE